MSETILKVTSADLAKLSTRLEKLLHQIHDLAPFMREASQYMLRSSKFRIRQGKTSPNGEPLAALSQLTVLLKGHANPLYQSGALYEGTNLTEVSPDGFTIKTKAYNKKTGVDYAPYVAGGFKNKGTVTLPDGRKVFPRGTVKARPFLGFSEENISRLARMLREHIEK